MPSISLASSLRSNLLSTYADAYSIQGLSPAVVSDFTRNYYRSGSTDSNFASTFDYTGASLKTMTDSDGKLKWGPHNLLIQSAALNTASWTPIAGSATALTFTEDTTTAVHRIIQGITLPAGVPITFRATISASTNRRFYLNMFTVAGIQILYDLNAGSVVQAANGVGSIINNGNGTFTVTATGVGTGTTNSILMQLNRSSSVTAFDDSYLGDGVSGLTITNMHVFRSDLGGMVNNPDTGNSYVPTTTSAVYLPRRGNHLYNGYAQVNKGLLLESQARTNLFRYSGNFTTADWFKSALTVSAATDDFYTLTSTGADSQVSQSAPVVGSSTYTFSAEFKARSQNFAYIQINTGDGTTKVNRCYVDLTTGQVVNVALVGGGLTGAAVSSVRVSSDTWRVILTATSDPNHTTFVTFSGPATSLSATSTGAGQTVDMRRLQIELGATPSSYIPTAGAAVTRAAELLQVKAPNLAVGANDFTNTTYWPAPNTINGLTFTRTAGSDGTGPYIDVRIAGVATSTGNDVIFVSTPSRTSASIGDTFTCSAVIQRVAGTLTGFSGIGCSIAFETAPSTFVSYASYTLVTSTSPTLNTVTSTVASGNQVKPAIIAAFTNGATVDVTYRIRGFQFDKAASRVTYPDQSNISMQIDGTMTGTPSTFTRWGGSLTNYLMQSASVGAYEFDTYVNLALGADDVNNGSIWTQGSSTFNGITLTRIGSGVDTDGLPYADYSVVGTALANDLRGVYTTPIQNSMAGGSVTTNSMLYQIRTGTVPAGSNGLRLDVVDSIAGVGVAIGTSLSAFGTSTTEAALSVTHTTDPTSNQVRPNLLVRTASGSSPNYTFRVKGFQFDKATSRLTYAVRGGSFTSGIDVPFNVASRHGATYINGAVNGTALTASSSTLPFPVLNASPIQLGPTFMGNIGDFRQWNTAVGNAGIVAASAPSLLPSLNLNFDSSNSSYIVNDWSE